MTPSSDPSLHPDESFGPGTDLAICLVAVLLLLTSLVVFGRQQALGVEAPPPRVEPPPEPPPPPPPKQVWTIQEGYDDEPLFEKDRAVLTPTARRQLESRLGEMFDALGGDDCNQLLIEGHASPEAPSGRPHSEQERWNVRLSVDRAMAVADFLYWQGIPYECMSISAFGRSHSRVLATWLQRPGERRSLQTWDAADEPADESELAPERLVRIFATLHPDSVCDLAWY
jgi:outer membrane protein OmpA-like peptidoglycan-associated protein